MTRAKDVEGFAKARPFQPFEIQLVDGRRFRLKSIESFVIGRSAMPVLSPEGILVHVGIGLISTLRPSRLPKSRRRRERA